MKRCLKLIRIKYAHDFRMYNFTLKLILSYFENLFIIFSDLKLVMRIIFRYLLIVFYYFYLIKINI